MADKGDFGNVGKTLESKGFINYSGFHGYGSKKLALEVKDRYLGRSFKGHKLFSAGKVSKKKMSYGETRFFTLMKLK